MKKILLLAALYAAPSFASAQQMRKPSAVIIQQAPLWAQAMYNDQTSPETVDSLYAEYYRSNAWEKTIHTAYYKMWKRALRNNLPAPTPVTAGNRTTSWSLNGPIRTFYDNGNRANEQTNVYSITQCVAHPNIVYCGTEPGEIYKSTDAGNNWMNVSSGYNMNGGVTAIAVDANDSNLVYAGAGSNLYKSTDGGISWNVTYNSNNLGVNEIFIHPTNAQVVIAATDKGLLRTNNGGASWSSIYTQSCYDVKLKPGTLNTLFIVKNNPSLIRAEFFISTDTGATFTQQNNGWYSSTDPARSDGGARLAVSPNNPNRVYAYLIGESKPNDYGFIGVYRSDDGGVTWTLPNSPAGGPYTTTHPNLAIGTTTWLYHQGFYNCAIVANPNNADEILIGGLNLWKSTDGGTTFFPQAGYIGGPLDMHVDMQDFRVTPTGTWITNDGGVSFSNDFYTSNVQVKMDGIHGAEWWGFGTGWNEDVMVGGLYHNGTIAYYQNYNPGDYLELGGAEPASGYVNPGVNRKVYSSDIGGAILPPAINQPIQRFGVGMWPNESYWASESSEMKFDPSCYNNVFIGNQNSLYKSTDGGASYNLVYTFGTSVNARISYMEIGWQNPNVMYVVQRPASGNVGKIWKTTDGGATFTQLTIPTTTGSSSRILLSINPENDNELWIAYAGGANGQKLFHTNDGGVTWNNISDASHNSQEGRSLLYVAGTNGALYYCTNTTVHYSDDNGATWSVVNTGLPLYLNALYARPFYRDGKVRISTYGKGIFEDDFIDQPQRVVARPQVDKLNYVINCTADSFYFEDHSVMNHQGASWQWQFPGGSPSSSTLRNPAVLYANAGTYIATLIITDGQNRSDTGTVQITVTPYVQNTNLSEGFQTAFPPQGWFTESIGGNFQWQLGTGVGGYGNSTQCALFDNYNIDAQGSKSDLRIRVDMTQQPEQELRFDYAYAEYGFPYSDSLEVLISTDCGVTFTSVWRKGGSQLATAPSNTAATFVPSASQWETDSIDLSAYATNTDLMIIFRNIGRFGQAVYVDNINLQAPSSIADPAAANGIAMLAPNPIVNNEPIYLITDSKEVCMVEVFDANGKLVTREPLQNKGIVQGLQNRPAGVYTYRIISEKVIRTGKIIKR
jgi:photosystem II stability/assembly factor-like uncharacterized protein